VLYESLKILHGEKMVKEKAASNGEVAELW
jgi:hypothetical protein